MEIIIIATVKIFLREISHKFFGRKGLILSISFYLIVPILMQIIIRHAGWGSLGIHKEGNLIAVFWGLFVGILWAGVMWLLTTKFMPGALRVFKKQMDDENFNLTLPVLLFTLFSSFCASLFYAGYFSVLFIGIGIPRLWIGLIIGILFAVTHYFFLLQNPNLDGLIAFVLAYFGTMSIVGYSYGFTHNILTAWMCWFISRVCILFFAKIGKSSFA